MIAFIGCVKTKKQERCEAAEIYTSPLFRYSYAYAIKQGAERIYILSAKHGIIPANTIIGPYNETLNGQSDAHLKRWAYKVVMQADALGIARTEDIMLLAGENYAKYIRKIYRNAQEPLKGLKMGERLSFLKKG